MTPTKNQSLKIAIGSKGLTQRQVAFAVGVSESFLSSVINGYKKPSRQIVEGLSLFLGVPPNELFPRGMAFHAKGYPK